MKRPLSVWIVQILLSIAFLVLIPGLFAWTVSGFTSLWNSSRPPLHVALFYAEFLIKIGLVAFLMLSVVAIGKRWPKARMMGLIALLILFVLVVYGQFNPTPAGKGLPKFELSSPAERGGASIAALLMFVGFWALFLRFGFSAKSRRFFSGPNPALNQDAQEPRAG